MIKPLQFDIKNTRRVLPAVTCTEGRQPRVLFQPLLLLLDREWLRSEIHVPVCCDHGMFIYAVSCMFYLIRVSEACYPPGGFTEHSPPVLDEAMLPFYCSGVICGSLVCRGSPVVDYL